MAENQGGRPNITPQELDVIVDKLKPYLEAGLSLHKSCLLAGVDRPSVYKWMDEYQWFSDKIQVAKEYLSKVTSEVLTHRAREIYIKLNAEKPEDRKISKDDYQFMQWFALNSNRTSGEFGERKAITPFDPETEFKRIIETIDERANNTETTTTEPPVSGQ